MSFSRRIIYTSLALVCVSTFRVNALAESTQESLTLQRAIELGLQNNPDLAVFAAFPDLAKSDVGDAEGATDTNFFATGRLNRDVSPSGSTIVGSKYQENFLESVIGLEKQLESGTGISLSWRNSRLKNSSLFQALNPQYSSGLSLNLSQPLLQGAWGGAPGVQIKIRQTSYDASLRDYAGELAKQVKNIIEVYWNKKLAEEILIVRERSLALAEVLRSDAEAIVKLGVQAPVAITEAKVEVSRQQQQVVVAKNELQTASAKLQRVLGGLDGGYSETCCVISDQPLFIRAEFERDSSIETALKKRPEIVAQNLKIQAAQLNLKSADNGLLPELNIISSAGVSGLSGRATQDNSQNYNPGPLQGGYNTALGQLPNADFYNAGIGFEFKVPFERSRAKARYSRANLEYTQSVNRLRALRQTITQEVTVAVGDLKASSDAIDLARQSNQLVLKSLESAREQFRVGYLKSRDIMSLQRDLVESEASVLRATIDFQLAATDVSLARGELLEMYGISLSHD